MHQKTVQRKRSRSASLRFREELYVKGKSGKRPETKETDPEAPPEPLRCAGCDSTEITHRDDQGFHYCNDHVSAAPSNAVMTKMEGEEMEKIRAHQLAAGVPAPPNREERQQLAPSTAAAPPVKDEDDESESADPFPRAVEKVLPVKLSEMELHGYQSRLSDEVSKLIDAENLIKELTVEPKETIKAAKKEITQLNLAIKSGVKSELIKCEWRPNWDENSKELYRLDTGERVDVQPLSFEDRQLELKGVKDKNDEPGKVEQPALIN